MRKHSFLTAAVLIFAGCRVLDAAEASQAAGSSNADRTIAVLEFVDKGPSVELAVLRTALAEMLTGDLSQYQGLRVVERARVDQFLREANLQEGFVDGAAGQRAGQALAAEFLLTGTFQGKEKAVTVKASLLEVGEMEPLAEWTQSAEVSELVDLEQELMANVLASLGIDKPVRRTRPKAKPGPSPKVAVLALRNLSPSARLDPMQSGFADVLQVNLAALKDVRLVEREQLYEVLKEQRLSLSGLVDPATAIQVGRLLGAQRMIYGSFVELGDHLRVDLRLTDVKSASILRAETAHGPTERFAELIEDLALRLAADLAVKPPADAAEVVKASTPTRKMEAALHFAAAQHAFCQERYEESAKAYERALLIAPDNFQAAIRRVRSWGFLMNNAKVVEAGEQMFSRGLLPKMDSPNEKVEPDGWKAEFFFTLANAYMNLGNAEGQFRVYRHVVAEFPGTTLQRQTRYYWASLLLKENRGDEAIRLLEQALKEAKENGTSDAYCGVLQTLYNYYNFGGPTILDRWPQYRKDVPQHVLRQQIAETKQQYEQRAQEVFQLALKEAEGKRGAHWRWWGLHALRRLTKIQDDRQKEEYLLQTLRSFSWVATIPPQVHQKLAIVRERLGKWEPAMENHRAYLADRGYPDGWVNLPDRWDQYFRPPYSRIDRWTATRFRMANICAQQQKPEQAAQQYQKLVDEFGLAHFLGVNTVEALDRLDREIVLPQKAALVWGGGETANKAWLGILEPKGFSAVHSVGLFLVNACDLALYPLVILVRIGTRPYAPSDVMALRNYVATGGSLLVVACPGWEPPQPGNQNSLLSVFGVHAEPEMAVRAESTRIMKHPITQGVDKAMAKNTVHLKVPPETALIEAGDRTVLAAIPYRHGRVVVASFGQWFAPKPDFPLWRVVLPRNHWTGRLPKENLPLEFGDGRELPLLDKVLAWLLEPSRYDEEFAQKHKRYVDAQRVSLKAQYGLATRRQLSSAMQKLIAEAESGTWREEMLWAAGEASLQQLWCSRDEVVYEYPKYHWHFALQPLAPATEHYRRLVDEFPESPLRPYAQWRLAECRRRELVNEAYAQSGTAVISDQGPVVSLLKKVEAAEGSYAWAWTQLRLGTVYVQSQDFASALSCFRKVVDRMDHGPEKSLALLNTALCYEALQNLDEAKRYYRIAASAPGIHWYSPAPFAFWAPLEFSGYGYYNGTTVGATRYRLNNLGKRIRSPSPGPTRPDPPFP